MFCDGIKVEQLVCVYNVCILVIELEYVVVEKIGYQVEIEVLLEEFKNFGVIYGFVCLGWVVIVKLMECLNCYLEFLQ